MNIPEELRYTKEHEWVRIEGDIAVIGITDYAQSELGDIVYVEVETEGETLNLNDEFGSVEAVKTVSSLYMPLSGEIVEFNYDLEGEPERVNNGAYDAWMIKVKMSNPSEVEALLDAAAYREIIGA